MLLQFSVENFLSFRDEVVLNLSAAESVRHPDRGAYAETEGGLFLRCAALYGANASGKSNLIRALETARQLVVRGTQPEDALDVIPFRLDESLREAPSRFTFHVALAGKRYEYSIEVDRQRVVAEHLYQTDEEGERLAFERSTEGPNAGIRIGPALGADAARSQFLRFVAEGTRPNQPFLAEARQRNVGELAPLSNWLDRGLLAVGPTSRVVQDLEARLDTDDELRRAFGQLLQKADVGISDLSIEHQPLAARYSPFVASPSSQLSLGIARSDDLWFVQKDARGASHLYSLAEFKAEQLRELTGTLEEGYLQGRFGATPLGRGVDQLTNVFTSLPHATTATTALPRSAARSELAERQATSGSRATRRKGRAGSKKRRAPRAPSPIVCPTRCATRSWLRAASTLAGG
ncbi:MAG: AAA family ATPase [Polyangiaceae bacterium]|nr:AAA family ATPase [Polyangiaceae bacterium]